jgi:predicted Rossmann fold flavoprotein
MRLDRRVRSALTVLQTGFGPDSRSQMPPFDYDVIVLGAGAAGLIAAARAAECGARVLLLEKNRRPGVKILISGGTRCNITSARGLRRFDEISGPIDPAYDRSQSQGFREIQKAFHENGAFLGPALRRFDVDATVHFFEEAGVATKIEANGKIFPVSDKAVDVLDALVRRVKRSGADLRCLSPVLEVDRGDVAAAGGAGFVVRVPEAVITSKRVIMAVGGASYPGCGTTGDGYEIARRFGHTVIEPKPALVPLRFALAWIAGLKGLTLPDVVASVEDSSAHVLQKRREAMLFAHFGLTGPAILDVSRAVARDAGRGRLTLRLDLIPDRSREEIDVDLQLSCRQGRRPVVGLLPGELPRRLAECLLAVAAIPPDRTGPEMSREERQRLVATAKGLALPIEGTVGFEKAEVTTGGVALDEVDPATLESRIVPGLHFAGEILDLDGKIGGYNFQSAWSTGWLSAEMAAKMGCPGVR